jgi:hypothetical protein
MSSELSKRKISSSQFEEEEELNRNPKKDKKTEEYAYFDEDIEGDDIFGRFGLQLTDNTLSSGLKEEVHIQEEYLTNYIKNYLNDKKYGVSYLDENTKIEILDTSLENFHTLVNYFFFYNEITKKHITKIPLYLPLYYVIKKFFELILNNHVKIIALSKEYNDPKLIELFSNIFNVYNSIINKNTGKIDKGAMEYENIIDFFIGYYYYERDLKEKLKKKELLKNVNKDKFNNPDLDYGEFDEGFYGGKKKRTYRRKTTRKHKKNKRKQYKGKSRKRKH